MRNCFWQARRQHSKPFGTNYDPGRQRTTFQPSFLAVRWKRAANEPLALCATIRACVPNSHDVFPAINHPGHEYDRESPVFIRWQF